MNRDTRCKEQVEWEAKWSPVIWFVLGVAAIGAPLLWLTGN